ncbi:hypothetical protein BDY24DRAFT_399120, partial [Mrakia frigida]|uniref:uncharacterized protein n=1 Tax=Mrakia frigida TaxID=29902 RepID=UPI003FCC0ABD
RWRSQGRGGERRGGKLRSRRAQTRSRGLSWRLFRCVSERTYALDFPSKVISQSLICSVLPFIFTDFLVPTLLLPNCSTLLLDLKHLDHWTFRPFPHIISQLPVQNLTLRDHTSHPSQGNHPSPLEPSTDDGLLFADVGLPSDQIWDDLVVVTMEGSVWADEVSWEDMSTDEGIERANLALSTWSFKVLVVRFDASYDRWDEGRIVYLFLDPDPMDLEGFLRSTERVEIRGGAPVEKEFRRVIGERREAGLSEFEKRIASLIVFVEEDGSERRLLEKVETL